MLLLWRWMGEHWIRGKRKKKKKRKEERKKERKYFGNVDGYGMLNNVLSKVLVMYECVKYSIVLRKQ